MRFPPRLGVRADRATCVRFRDCGGRRVLSQRGELNTLMIQASLSFSRLPSRRLRRRVPRLRPRRAHRARLRAFSAETNGAPARDVPGIWSGHLRVVRNGHADMTRGWAHESWMRGLGGEDIFA